MKNYIYIFSTILFTVYGQLIIKWRINNININIPVEIVQKFVYLFRLVFDPFIFSGFVAAFLAALSWIAAMSKFEISIAYPFMSLNFVLVFIFSIFILNESFTIGKVVGLILIIAGLIITVKV